MKLCVVGAGYVGLVTAACFAELGHDVTVVDKDLGRIAFLQSGGNPIFEPGLDELMARNTHAQRLRFTASLSQAVEHADMVFIAVGTPPQEDGAADVQHVLDVARQVGMYVRGFKVLVIKSTVPVGTSRRVERAVAQELERRGLSTDHCTVVSNPEFLKEGAAIDDFMRPDRIVIGVPHGRGGERARQCMTRLCAPFNRHHDRTVWMDVASAELTKYAANAMLATRISFMNEMAALADAAGADIDSVRRGVGADTRIGNSFLYAGVGYGGSCFPKDTQALIHTAQLLGHPMKIVRAVEWTNQRQKSILLRHVNTLFGEDLSGLTFGVWGLAFKPNTNDMREAPSRVVVPALLQRGARVVAHDPVAMDLARCAIQDDLGRDGRLICRLELVDSPDEALRDADALLVLTEWKCFHNLDFERLRERMRQPLVLDGRNLYDPQQAQELGVAHIGVGRRNALGAQRLAGAPALL